MKTRPTEDQIKAVLAELRSLESSVRPFSAFGDDNRAAIGAQIDVLEERMSVDRVYGLYGEDAFEDEMEFDQYTLDCAVDAADWLAGELAEGMESLADHWKGIAS